MKENLRWKIAQYFEKRWWKNYLREKKLASSGDPLVVISDILAEGSRFDCVQLRAAK